MKKEILNLNQPKDKKVFSCHLFISTAYLTKKIAGKKPEDSLIKTFEEHEDSVYSVAWGAATTWLFASLSYPFFFFSGCTQSFSFTPQDMMAEWLLIMCQKNMQILQDTKQ